MRRIMAYAMFIGLGAVLMYVYISLNPTEPTINCSPADLHGIYTGVLLQVRQEVIDDVKTYGIHNLIPCPVIVNAQHVPLVQFSNNLIWLHPCQGPECPSAFEMSCADPKGPTLQIFDGMVR